jgi:hypothetical protein
MIHPFMASIFGPSRSQVPPVVGGIVEFFGDIDDEVEAGNE